MSYRFKREKETQKTSFLKYGDIFDLDVFLHHTVEEKGQIYDYAGNLLMNEEQYWEAYTTGEGVLNFDKVVYYSKQEENLTNEEILIYLNSYYLPPKEDLKNMGYSYWEIEAGFIEEILNREEGFLKQFDIYDNLSDIPENTYSNEVPFEDCQNKNDGKYYLLKPNQKDCIYCFKKEKKTNNHSFLWFNDILELKDFRYYTIEKNGQIYDYAGNLLMNEEQYQEARATGVGVLDFDKVMYYTKKSKDLTHKELLLYMDGNSYYHNYYHKNEIFEKRGYSYWEIKIALNEDLCEEMLNREDIFLEYFDTYDNISDIPKNTYSEKEWTFQYSQNKNDGKYYLLKPNKNMDYSWHISKDENLTEKKIHVFLQYSDSSEKSIFFKEQGYSYWESREAIYKNLCKEMLNREERFLEHFDIYDNISDIPDNTYSETRPFEDNQNKNDGKYYFLKYHSNKYKGKESVYCFEKEKETNSLSFLWHEEILELEAYLYYTVENNGQIYDYAGNLLMNETQYNKARTTGEGVLNFDKVIYYCKKLKDLTTEELIFYLHEDVECANYILSRLGYSYWEIKSPWYIGHTYENILNRDECFLRIFDIFNHISEIPENTYSNEVPFEDCQNKNDGKYYLLKPNHEWINFCFKKEKKSNEISFLGFEEVFELDDYLYHTIEKEGHIYDYRGNLLMSEEQYKAARSTGVAILNFDKVSFYTKKEVDLTKEELLSLTKSDNCSMIDDIIEEIGYSFFEREVASDECFYEEMLNREDCFLEYFDIYENISDIPENTNIHKYNCPLEICKNKKDNKYYILKSNKSLKSPDCFFKFNNK